MIISIWRYSHLALAVSSFVFILVASITGIVLAFEPISEQLKPYAFDLDQHNLAETLTVLEDTYDEVITLERDHNNFLIADVITKDGDSQQFYINPETGEKVGDLIESAPIFKLMTNIHRSLFLKSTGRAMIGIASFLLFLIAVTGVILIAKRQGGISKWFSKVIKEDQKQYYHVVLGRYSLIPIVILTLTGVYLSMEKFSLLPEEKISHTYEFSEETPVTKLKIKDFLVFQKVSLSELKKVEFPFSDDPEDYFLVNLRDRELLVNQFSGTVLSEVQHPFVTLASSFSLNLHTGRGSIFWSVILLLATASILYFIYSGFAMTFQRRKQNAFIPKNIYTQNEAEYVILVGSETGSTYKPAKWVFDAIQNLGKKVFITEMNAYTNFPQMKELLVFTSTYGTGEAPTNANQFLEKLNAVENSANYSVVGFGSLAYPDFCEFAIDVNSALENRSNFTASTPLYKIHNQSVVDFKKWAADWSRHAGLTLEIEQDEHAVKLPKQHNFEVIQRSKLNLDETFTIQLRPKQKVSYQSGDLLVMYPKDDSVARYYSIGLSGKNILLSIKKHEFGVCSQYFSQLNSGDHVIASIQKNKHFHFPKEAKEVILIANGTGIAPFLGMLQEVRSHQQVHLFWGGRTKASFELYQDLVQKAIDSNQLSSLRLAYSREGKQKEYVQDLLSEHQDLIARVLNNKGTIMICGSLVMEKGVKETLENMTLNLWQSPLTEFKDQITSDCY
jgi:sulfite reductase (NADPH) flavoprotein alpha-component